MMKRNLIAAFAACAFAAPAFAQGNNYIDGFFALSELENEDGNGFGLKGEFQVHDKLFLNGEFQSVDYDDNFDVDQLRLGGAMGPGAGSKNEGVFGRIEYVSLDLGNGSGSDQDGVGGHVGYALPLSPEFRVHGQAGYVLLDDVDGPEFLIGATYKLAQNVALFGDYRVSFLEVDGTNGADLDVSDLRLGARFLF